MNIEPPDSPLSEPSPPLEIASETHMRLFVAVPLDSTTMARVAELDPNVQKGFRFTPSRPAWVPLDAFHITLAFIGKFPAARLASLIQGLTLAASGFGPMKLEVKGLGVFPNWVRPGVLWTGVRDRSHQLESLHQAIEAALEPFGCVKESRDFHAHVTLARFKNIRGISACEKIVKSHASFAAGGFETSRIELVHSDLRQGYSYRSIASFPLTKAIERSDSSPAFN